MSSGSTTRAFSLDTSGAGFCLRFQPLDAPRLHMVFLPALGEEMNRCRQLVATQARWFARQGICCTLLDYAGTGDSRWEIADARLDHWRADVDRAVTSLTDAPECPVALWGMRMGALLALDYGARHPSSLSTLLLWQPLVSGKRYVSQLRRQYRAGRIQASSDGNREKETTDEVAETGIEVGGYALSEPLLDDIASLSVDELDALPAPQVKWFEHVDVPDEAITGAGRRAIDRLQAMGASVEEQPFTGDPVWQLHKRGWCDPLLEKTRRLDLWTR